MNKQCGAIAPREGDMERLTCGNFDGQCDHHTMAIDGCFNKTEDRFMLCEDCVNKKRYDKLKQYEDLEKAGLLVRLPCKVGDTVYIVNSCGIGKEIVYGFDICSNKVTNIDLGWTWGNITDFGNRLFLTREEAEKRFKELRND